MVRTQIQLSEEQKRKLKKIAAERGVSVAELIRRGVDMILEADGRPEQGEMLRRAAGRFRSSKTDIATAHDRYLDRAFSQ